MPLYKRAAPAGGNQIVQNVLHTWSYIKKIQVRIKVCCTVITAD